MFELRKFFVQAEAVVDAGHASKDAFARRRSNDKLVEQMGSQRMDCDSRQVWTAQRIHRMLAYGRREQAQLWPSGQRRSIGGGIQHLP